MILLGEPDPDRGLEVANLWITPLMGVLFM